jgi:hypothetical protein
METFGMIILLIYSKISPNFVQNDSDKNLLKSQGFKDIKIVGDDTPFKGITITKMKERILNLHIIII